MRLVWLPNRDSALTTCCRGSVLIVEPRGAQWHWTATVAGQPVREGNAAGCDGAKTDAMAAAVAMAAGDAA